MPIIDVFRRVDADTLLGVMDLRGSAPYVFVLQRDAPEHDDGNRVSRPMRESRPG